MGWLNNVSRKTAELRKMAKRSDSKSGVSEFDSLVRYARLRKMAKRTDLESVVSEFDSLVEYAGVMKLVYIWDLKSQGFGREGSSPSTRTNYRVFMEGAVEDCRTSF